MKQQEIIWAEIPFADLKETKVRPVVVISNTDYNQSHDDVLVCALTSNLKKRNSLKITSKDLEGELPVTSKIRIDKIFSIEKKFTRGTLGKLKDSVYETLAEKIFMFISRGPP